MKRAAHTRTHARTQAEEVLLLIAGQCKTDVSAVVTAN